MAENKETINESTFLQARDLSREGWKEYRTAAAGGKSTLTDLLLAMLLEQNANIVSLLDDVFNNLASIQTELESINSEMTSLDTNMGLALSPLESSLMEIALEVSLIKIELEYRS